MTLAVALAALAAPVGAYSHGFFNINQYDPSSKCYEEFFVLESVDKWAYCCDLYPESKNCRFYKPYDACYDEIVVGDDAVNYVDDEGYLTSSWAHCCDSHCTDWNCHSTIYCVSDRDVFMDKWGWAVWLSVAALSIFCLIMLICCCLCCCGCWGCTRGCSRGCKEDSACCGCCHILKNQFYSAPVVLAAPRPMDPTRCTAPMDQNIAYVPEDKPTQAPIIIHHRIVDSDEE